MAWDRQIEDIRARAALAKEHGGAEPVARQHAKGRMTIRERVDGLLRIRTGCADKLLVRAGPEVAGDELTFSLSPGFRFLTINQAEQLARHPDGSRKRVYRWTPLRAGSADREPG